MPYFVIQSLCWGTHTLELCQCKALNRFDTEGILCPCKSPSTYFAPQSTINLPRSQKSIFNRGHWSILKNIDFFILKRNVFLIWKKRNQSFKFFQLWCFCGRTASAAKRCHHPLWAVGAPVKRNDAWQILERRESECQKVIFSQLLHNACSTSPCCPRNQSLYWTK